MIDQIRKENQRAQREREAQTIGQGAADGSAGLFQGLISLAARILDSFDGQAQGKVERSEQSETKLAQRRGLLDEIFTRFLFPTVFEGNAQGKGGGQTMAQVIEASQKKRASGSEEPPSKRAAYKLLNSLVRQDPGLMKHFVKNCV